MIKISRLLGLIVFICIKIILTLNLYIQRSNIHNDISHTFV